MTPLGDNISDTELNAYVTDNILNNRLKEYHRYGFILLQYIYALYSMLIFIILYNIFYRLGVFKIKYYKLLLLLPILFYLFFVFIYNSVEIPIISPISVWILLWLLSNKKDLLAFIKKYILTPLINIVRKVLHFE